MANVAYKYEDVEMEVNELAPDDSGNSWKNPFLWQENPEDIHNFVMEEINCDDVFPRGYQILIKLWMPPQENEHGWVETDHDLRDAMQSSTIGKILRMGKEAFTDKKRFPFGPTVTYGEWAIFRGTERQKLATADGTMLALVNDDRFMAVASDPAKVKTYFTLEHDWADH